MCGKALLCVGARTCGVPSGAATLGCSSCPPEREARTTVLDFSRVGPKQSVLRTLADRMSAIQPAEIASWKATDLPHIRRHWRKNMQNALELDRRREEFPTLASGIHLLSHSLGPMPRAARDSMNAYI